MKQIINKIKIISIFFITIAFQGCVEDQVAFPKAFAEFTYTVNQETGVVKFLNTSRNATIFSWTFGDGQTSNEINPKHIYQPGTYTVSLVSKNIAGSFRTYQDIIVILDPNSNPGGGGPSACTAEDAENINPANGDLNWTFKTNDTAHTFAAFGNTAGSIVANPVLDAVNSSCNVEEYVKTSGCETWSGLGTALPTALDFTSSSTKKVFKMKVLANNQVANVTLRLERLPYPDTDPAVEKVATITKVGAWEELTFDFSNITSGTYKSMIIYFERNATCDGDIYYFDDIKQVAGGAGGGGTVCTAESVESLSATDFNLTFKTNDVAVIQDGTAYTRVANPKEDAVNGSCFAGKVINSGTNPWDNVQINVASKIDFNTNAGFKLKVYSLKAGTKVTMKLEEIGAAGTNSGDVAAVRTKTGEWEELTFPFPATANGKYNKIVIFFDLEAKDTDTYHFDDLKLYPRTTGSGGTGGCTGTVVAATAFPVNFEGCQSFTETFKDSGSITTELSANPSKTGINTSDFVLKVVKDTGTNRWAGFQNAFPSNFDATKTFKVKVYSSKANVVMRFEINSNPQPNTSGNPGPQFKTIVAANTWTEVTVIFTGIPGNNTGMNQLVIKPDNPDGTDGTLTSSTETYYFDDVRLE